MNIHVIISYRSHNSDNHFLIKSTGTMILMVCLFISVGSQQITINWTWEKFKKLFLNSPLRKNEEVENHGNGAVKWSLRIRFVKSNFCYTKAIFYLDSFTLSIISKLILTIIYVTNIPFCSKKIGNILNWNRSAEFSSIFR